MMDPRAKAPVLIADMLFFILSTFKFLSFRIFDIAGTALLLTSAAATPIIMMPVHITPIELQGVSGQGALTWGVCKGKALG